MNIISEKLAAAPISWGVSEVPGWGHQAEPDQVLSAMRELGFTATEFGPDGFLPRDPTERRDHLAAAGLQAIGGFYPAVLHEPGLEVITPLTAELEAYAAAGADTLVLAADTGREGYDSRPELADHQWDQLAANVRAVQQLAQRYGIQVALHPHIGTVVETAEEVSRVVEATGVGICLDTGHLAAAGADVLEFTRRHRDAIVHTHLKDVDESVVDQYRTGEITFTQGVQERGLFVPVGRGDLPFEEIVRELLEAGYSGWFTFEQDCRLRTAEDLTASTDDARISAEYLRELGARLA